MTDVTTIKVPKGLRDRIRVEATARHLSQAEFISSAIDEMKQAEFLRAVANQEPDSDYLAEFREWDDAKIATPLNNN